jgi:hypothetical protein
MAWVDDLLKIIINQKNSEPKEINFSFSGKATDNIEHKPEWDRGFEDGYWWTMKNWKLTKPSKFPEGWGEGWYGHGFAEGNISARNQILDRDYPGMSGLSWVGGYRYEITFKDGRKIIVGE